nr:protein FAM184A-like [Rhipicephalus microplus]
MIYTTPREDDAKKIFDLKVIKLDGKGYEVKTCMAAPESCDKRVSCGVASPPKDHECTPRCCPGDKRCKELFRTPYIVKKRQWEMKLEEAREQEERRKAEEGTQWHSRTDGVQDRSRRKFKHRSTSRGRSESFPQLPPLEKPGVSHKASHDGGDCSQEKSKSTGPQARLKYIGKAAHTEYESTLQNLREKLRETKAEQKRRVEELLASQERYQEEVKLKDRERLEYAQVWQNIERRLEVRHAAEMEALKLEHRTDIEVLRESLQQELQDVKTGSEEEQLKMHRSLESEHNLVANSQKAQKAQIKKMKEVHASVVKQLAVKRVQMEQHMAENTSSIQEIKSKP